MTSAVQRRILNIVVVHQCSKTPANKHILSYSFRNCSLLFVWVAARLLHADPILSAEPRYPILLHVDLPPHPLGYATALCLSPIG